MAMKSKRVMIDTAKIVTFLTFFWTVCTITKKEMNGVLIQYGMELNNLWKT
ncbi:hypothetical protein [Filibacter tadaridae]|uniref:hypothetical protein n=1 Tax=Filibacter tadaridae TaxID=2483811 RepID=UPI0039EC6B92